MIYLFFHTQTEFILHVSCLLWKGDGEFIVGDWILMFRAQSTRKIESCLSVCLVTLSCPLRVKACCPWTEGSRAMSSHRPPYLWTPWRKQPLPPSLMDNRGRAISKDYHNPLPGLHTNKIVRWLEWSKLSVYIIYLTTNSQTVNRTLKTIIIGCL